MTSPTLARGAGGAPRVLRVDAERLRAGEVRPVADRGAALVGCGGAIAGQEVVIVDPETRVACAPTRVGEIWVRGPSVAAGYWRRDAETAATFRAALADGTGPYLRTGDLGFLHADELFVTGRLKDLVIVRGQNHAPSDLERTAEEAVPGLRPGCGVAFAVPGPDGEALVLVHEVDRGAASSPQALGRAVRRAIAEAHGIEPDAVVLVRPGVVPKTSSGKLQRLATRELYLEGALDPIFVDQRQAPAATSALDLGALAVLAPEARAVHLGRHIALRLAGAAGVEVDAVPLDAPLIGLGLDSLRLVQLFDQLEGELGLRVELTTLGRGTSVADLAQGLAQRLLESPTAARALLDRLDGIPEDAVARLVAEFRPRHEVSA